MRDQVSICALLAAAALFGCASHDDEAPSNAAGQAGASAGASSAGAINDGGRTSTGGEAGDRAGANTTGGTSTIGGAPGNVAGGAGASAGSAGRGGTASGCQLPLTTGDHSHLTAEEGVTTYSVSGTTAQELRQSINANRGRDYDGLTTWNIGSRYQDCSNPIWTVTLDLVYNLPHWEPPPTADAALVASWDQYIAALDCHEYGHGKLALDCANSIYDALVALPATGDCDALSAAAHTTVQQLIASCQMREDDYDAQTMHGATMGAVFPRP